MSFIQEVQKGIESKMSVIINRFTLGLAYWGILETYFVFILLLTVGWLYTWARLINEKKRCLQLESHLTMMEKAIEAYRNIRHQHNNLLQSVVFYIENEQWAADKNFVNEIMEKTAELNKNSMLQMVKIKNYALRSAISKMAEICDKNEIEFSIFVTGEVNYINMHESALCTSIDTIFHYNFDEVMRCSRKEIIIEVSSDSQGVLICFEGSSQQLYDSDLNRRIGQKAIMKTIAKNKNVIFNSYTDTDCYRQELMIL